MAAVTICSDFGAQEEETVTDFLFLASKITVDGDCSHEILKDSCILEGML